MAYFQAILVFGIGSNSGADSSDSNQNEPEPEPHKLVAPKEPKSDSKADSKAGITAALICVRCLSWFHGKDQSHAHVSLTLGQIGTVKLQLLQPL